MQVVELIVDTLFEVSGKHIEAVDYQKNLMSVELGFNALEIAYVIFLLRNRHGKVVSENIFLTLSISVFDLRENVL